jgi:single-strand selective monofunctional uracil DNA glycosylase
VSGSRLWGWAKTRFGTPQQFFARFFVINYCPLVFIESSGRNRTPDKLPASERASLLSACDQALRSAIDVLDPELVIGVGAWATKRVSAALDDDAPRIGTVLHPSPASPKANRGWAPQAESDLRALGVEL